MKIKITLLICLMSWAQFSLAQDFRERIILHRGFSAGMFTSPAAKFTAIIPPGQSFADPSYEYPTSQSLFVGLHWGGRVNLYDFSPEKSISLNIGFVGSGYMSAAYLQSDPGDVMDELGYALQIPITVNYNVGHIASRSSNGETGFVVGAGIEVNRLFSTWERDFSYKHSVFYKGVAEEGAWNYIQPVLNLGYRYWNSNDKARELNLQVGYGAVDRLSYGNFSRPSVRLSLLKYINY